MRSRRKPQDCEWCKAFLSLAGQALCVECQRLWLVQVALMAIPIEDAKLEVIFRMGR
jgi:hypothetical protein